MLKRYCRFVLSRRHIGHAIILVGLGILPHPIFSQATAGGKSQTIKVKVISNLIVMPGYVNKSAKMDVVLDTGASVSILSPERAAELKLNSMTSTHAAGLGKGQDETMHLFSGVSLAWGIEKNLYLGGQMIAALPIDYISRQTGYGVNGIFGSPLFQHFQVRVDYEESEVRFTSGDAHSNGGTAIPIKLNGGTPFVQALIETARGEKIPALFLVDSGTAGDLILNKKFLDAHPSIAMGHPWVSVPAFTAVGGAIDMKFLRITGLELGPFHLTRPVAAVPSDPLGVLSSPGLAGFVGAGILSHFTVDWNYPGLTMTLTPNRRYGAPFEVDASGMRLVAERPSWETIRVEAVMPDSPAAVAGIQAGDTLQKVGGEAPPPLYELERLLARPGRSIIVTVLRSGKQKTMTVHLRRLV
jgi:membrane-associated protease RseP (regulator of RpoE activity)